MNVAKYNMTEARAKSINNSLMGAAGYVYIYAGLNSVEEYFNTPAADRPELPFDEFISYGDKHGKKAISYNKKNSNPCITTAIKGQPFDIVAYVDYAEKVAMHYKAAVGNSYATCSQLVFAAAELLYHGEEVTERYTRTLRACVVSWRLIYEGLGLAGWSENATTFFKYAKPAAFDYEVGRVKITDARVMSFYARNGVEMNAVSNITGCIVEAGALEAVVTRELVRDLLRSQAVVTAYQQLERQGKTNKSIANLETAGIIAGNLRRIGQGSDPVAVEAADAGSHEEGPVSMTEAFHNEGVASILRNPFLSTVAGKASEAHAVLREVFSAQLSQ